MSNPAFAAKLIGWTALCLVCSWPFFGPWGALIIAVAVVSGVWRGLAAH